MFRKEDGAAQRTCHLREWRPFDVRCCWRVIVVAVTASVAVFSWIASLQHTNHQQKLADRLVDSETSAKATTRRRSLRASWLIEQGLTSHQTHYRSYRRRVFTTQMTQPTHNVKALKEDRVLRIRLQSHQVHPAILTIIQQLYSMKQKTHKIHTDKHKITLCTVKRAQCDKTQSREL